MATIDPTTAEGPTKLAARAGRQLERALCKLCAANHCQHTGFCFVKRVHRYQQHNSFRRQSVSQRRDVSALAFTNN